MFKVGDKVVRNPEFLTRGTGSWTKDRVYTVIGTRPERVGTAMNTQIADDNGYTTWWDNTRFTLYVEPAAEGIKRLRVIEGLGVLRAGTVVSVRDESETSYLLNEHPGKRYRKTRFEELASTEVRAITEKPAPVKADYKKGEAVYIVGQPKAGILGGYYERTLSFTNGYLEQQARKRVDLAISEKLKLFIVGNQFPYNYDGVPYFMVSNEPEGEFFIAVTPDMILPYPEAKALKRGDKVKPATNGEITIERHGGEGSQYFMKSLTDKVVMRVVTIDDKRIVLANEAHSWIYALEDLAFADGSPILGGAPFGKAKEQEPLPDIVKALQYEGAPSGTSGYSILFKGATKWKPYLNMVCYGSMSSSFTGAVERVGITTHHMRSGHYKLKPGNEEHALRWYDYLINRSPWADCFLKTAEIPDAATGMKVGFEMNPEKSVSQIITAAIAARDAWEFQGRLKTFSHFIDEGFHEHTAYIMAWVLNEGDGKFVLSSMSDSHTNMSGETNAEEFFKFFKGGYHLDVVLKKEKPLTHASSKNGYVVSRGLASEKGERLNTFIKNNLKVTTTGTGFHAVTHVTLEAANELAAIIDKEIQ